MNALALTHNEVYYFSIKIAFVHRGSVFVAVFTEALCDLPNYGNNSRTCERKKLTKLFGCSVPHRGTRPGPGLKQTISTLRVWELQVLLVCVNA